MPVFVNYRETEQPGESHRLCFSASQCGANCECRVDNQRIFGGAMLIDLAEMSMKRA
jgi:hypothetical protein